MLFPLASSCAHASCPSGSMDIPIRDPRTMTWSIPRVSFTSMSMSRNMLAKSDDRLDAILKEAELDIDSIDVEKSRKRRQRLLLFGTCTNRARSSMKSYESSHNVHVHIRICVFQWVGPS